MSLGAFLILGNKTMTAQEITNAIDFSSPYSKAISSTLTSNTDTTTQDITMGNVSLYVDNIGVSAMDSAGKILDSNNTNVFDTLTIQIIDENGQSMFDNPIPLQVLQARVESKMYRGFVMEANKKYSVNIDGTGFPAVAKCTYPVRCDIVFSGNKLRK